MLELINSRPRNFLRRRASRMLAQSLSGMWVMSELSKIFEVKALKDRHPFFATLNSCLPLLKKQSLPTLFWNLLVKAPYISTVLNLNIHKHTKAKASSQMIPHFPLPAPMARVLNGKS